MLAFVLFCFVLLSVCLFCFVFYLICFVVVSFFCSTFFCTTHTHTHTTHLHRQRLVQSNLDLRTLANAQRVPDPHLPHGHVPCTFEADDLCGFCECGCVWVEWRGGVENSPHMYMRMSPASNWIKHTSSFLSSIFGGSKFSTALLAPHGLVPAAIKNS